jgi:hypothetical protein
LDKDIEFSFPSVDSLAANIRSIGPSALLFKKDLARAYRQFRTDPGDAHLLGYCWEGKLYIDMALAMGICSAAFLCQRFTSAIKFICQQFGFSLLNYIDDMAVCIPPSQAKEAFSVLQSLLSDLGIQEAKEKSYGPSPAMEVFGVMFDVPSMTMSVTPSRLNEISNLIDSWLLKRKATKRDLQSLLGKLQFVAKCVRSGRIFISRLLGTLSSLKRQHHRFKLSVQFKLDLRWWQRFLRQFNGITIIPDMIWAAPDTLFSTDASLKACGGWCGDNYFSCVFPKEIVSKYIVTIILWNSLPSWLP